MFLFLISLLQPFPITPYLETEVQFTPIETQKIESKPKPRQVNIQALASVIGKAESDTAGGYNAANAGQAFDLGRNGLSRFAGRPCHEIRIGEIKKWQRRGLLYAVGRFQMIPGTLNQAAKWAKLSDADYFSPENQDKMLVAILQHKRPKVWAYLTNNATINQALDSLAKEWSGLPMSTGYGYYGHANVSLKSIRTALMAAKV
jgi:muramidase (phage lysozyme)